MSSQVKSRAGRCRFGSAIGGVRVCLLMTKPCCMVETCPDGRAGLKHGPVTLDMVMELRARRRKENPHD